MRKILFLLICLGLAAPQAFAESMILKTGRQLDGTIVDSNERIVTIRVDGVNHSYRLDEIKYFGDTVRPDRSIIQFSAPITEPVIHTAVVEAPAPEAVEAPAEAAPEVIAEAAPEVIAETPPAPVAETVPAVEEIAVSAPEAAPAEVVSAEPTPEAPASTETAATTEAE